MMTTLTIKVKDSKTLKLIEDLEALDLIQVVNHDVKKTSKLSALLKGSVSAEKADEMQAELNQIRSEWDRNTY